MKTFTIISLIAVMCFSWTFSTAQNTSPKQKPSFLKEKTTNTTKASTSYQFTKSTGTYADLTGTTSVNNNQTWDDPEFIVPIGFPFNLYGKNIDSVYFGIGTGAALSDYIDLQTYEFDFLIVPFEADLIDRGENTGNSVSPISYKVEGSAGSRIFKLEWKNAGFYEENSYNGTLNDYVNIQLWLYETSNIIEFRYGTSLITNPLINYDGETGAIIGLTDYDILNAFVLSGNVANPVVVDSLTFIDGTPANGTIYKFTPLTIGTDELKNDRISATLYPNPVTENALIEVNGFSPKDAIFKLYNTRGQLVKTISNINSNKISISKDQLESGIYYYTIEQENQQLLRSKMIVL
ncbi:MAG: T9SS type A sorting domain-containing protein [Bacteroidales bacterium]|nr:T9SS type A sorting domain-containing protein [Bacteroidales bacterium]